MHNPVQKIMVKGREVEVLLTPSLYRVCKERGWEIKTSSDLSDIESAYIKLIYAGVINAYEIRRFDDPSIPDLDVRLIDIEIWATANREQFVNMIKTAVELLTGKSVEALAKEKSDEKKKKTKKPGRFWATMTRLRLSL